MAISKLFEKVKNGGDLLIWVYGYEGNESLNKAIKLIKNFYDQAFI